MVRSTKVRWILPVAAVLCATPAAAQSRDFLFGAPRATVGLRVGVAEPRASSEIFDFTTSELTLDRGDFRSLDVAVDLAIRVRDRLDVVATVGHAESETRSEFRDWLGTDDLPIEQTTRFSRTPITLGVKGYLRDRGRSVSRFAWVPNDWAPYVSAAAGFMNYEFLQAGEFVDYDAVDGEMRDIFRATLRSSGVAPVARAGAGLELAIGRNLLATGELGYLWSRADMSRDFVDFDRIDLSGAQFALGVALRF